MFKPLEFQSFTLSGVDTRTIRAQGAYVHIDAFGRVFIDLCKTEAEHMAAPADESDPDDRRRRCRIPLADLLRGLEGKKLAIMLTAGLIEENE